MGFNARIFTVTNAGFALFAKAQSGGVIRFTRFALGDGDIGELSASTLTALLSERASAAIESNRVSGARCTLSTKLLMTTVAAPFYWRELGIYATDGEREVLYAHASTATPEYIDPAGGTTDKILSAQLEVGSAQVTIQIMPSAMLVSFDDLDRATTPEALLGKIALVDGTGSELDADLLDGKHSSEYATAAQGTKADNAVPNTRTVNGKALSANISLAASDVGALPASSQAVDSAKLGGQLPAYYGKATDVAGKQDNLVALTVTLPVAGWSNNQQTVSVPGVTADASKTVVWVGAASASKEAYDGAGIYASAQGADTLTFTCSAPPSTNVQANVVVGKVVV